MDSGIEKTDEEARIAKEKADEEARIAKEKADEEARIAKEKARIADIFESFKRKNERSKNVDEHLQKKGENITLGELEIISGEPGVYKDEEIAESIILYGKDPKKTYREFIDENPLLTMSHWGEIIRSNKTGKQLIDSNQNYNYFKNALKDYYNKINPPNLLGDSSTPMLIGDSNSRHIKEKTDGGKKSRKNKNKKTKRRQKKRTYKKK
jgi:hypothetical protein